MGLAVAVGLTLVVYLAQDALIFLRQPIAESRRAQIAGAHPQVADLWLAAADGPRIHAWHVKSGSPLLIYFGGNAEEVSWMIHAASTEVPGAS